jgi:aryl-alcohol dehydrogenase-like predicted oxidoreductase
VINHFLLKKKLVLGTAQFGSFYGVANKNNNGISKKKIIKILNFCKKNKIYHIDTARNYCNSEKKLGKSGIDEFNIITKIPKLNLRLGANKLREEINNFFLESCNNLLKKKLYGLLLHNGEQLLSNKGDIIYNSLLKIKKENNIKNIGVSVHNPVSLKKIINRYKFNIAQVPFNIFDNRIYDQKIVSLLKKRNVKIHCRSIFLQGLLLMKYSKIPKHLKKFFYTFFLNTKDSTNDKLNLCLKHALFHKEIDKFIIGIDNIYQLIQISKILENITPRRYTEYKTSNIKVIDPLRWHE